MEKPRLREWQPPLTHDLEVCQSAMLQDANATGWRQIFWLPYKKRQGETQDHGKLLALREMR